MSELDARVGTARRAVESVYAKAMDRLAEGVDVERIHGHFVVGATGMLEEVELQAILASGGDREALAQIDALVDDLERLLAELEDEKS